MTRLVWTLPDGQDTARWAEDEGGGGYAAGTDRLVARLTNVTFPAGQTTDIDWTGADGFVAGTAIAVVGNQIVFVEGGCYSVEIHFPGGPYDANTNLSVECVLKLALSGTEWSDGADTALSAGLTDSALDAKYIYPQNPGDSVIARLKVIGAVDATVASIYAQIVKLSNVSAGDEFA